MASEIKTTADMVYRDWQSPGLPDSGAHYPVKPDIRSLFGMIQTAIDLLEQASFYSGTAKVVATRAQLAALPAPAVGDKAQVVADPAGDVTNGNGVYRWSGTAWVWLAPNISQELQDDLLSAAIAAAEAVADEDVRALAQHVASLIQPSEDPYIMLGDEGGFQIPFLTPDGLFIPAPMLDAEDFQINGDGDGLMAQDGYGYMVSLLDWTPASMIESDSLLIIQDDGVAFAVGDEFGFFPVYVPAGRSLGPTDQIEERLAALEAGGVGGGKAWPRLAMAGVEMCAHRGVVALTASPENSLDSVRLAARMGYRLVECDAMLTSDKAIVVMHDATIDRTMRVASDYSVPSNVRVDANTYETLRDGYVLASADLGMRRPIPLLADYLKECKRYGIKPMIEIKDTWDEASLDDLVEQCESYMGWDGFALTGFNSGYLDYTRTLRADIERYYILTFNSAMIDHVVEQGGIFYCNLGDATAALVEEAHLKGLKVAGWTGSQNLFDDYVEMGFDCIATDLIAPELDRQALVYSTVAEPLWADFTTTGTKQPDGRIVLAAGQSIAWKSGLAPAVDQGAWYAAIEFVGDVAVTAQQTSTGNRNHPVLQGRVFQCRMTATTTFSVTAGPGGATVKSLALAIASF